MAEREANHRPGRKRDRTRNRLLVATQELLAERTAGSLTILEVSRRARVSHGTFYNYFDSLEALLQNLALLVAFAHARALGGVTSGCADAAEVFSVSTRQTLRFGVEAPAYGRFLYDVGLPIDHFAAVLRAGLRVDLERGRAEGVFVVPDLELTLSLVAGSLLGVGLAIHRGELGASAIDPATEQLLVFLGVDRARARTLVALDVPFVAPPALPLEWPVTESEGGEAPAPATQSPASPPPRSGPRRRAGPDPA